VWLLEGLFFANDRLIRVMAGAALASRIREPEYTTPILICQELLRAGRKFLFMIIAFLFLGDGQIQADASGVTVLPNRFGGVRTIEVTNPDMIWTGHFHLAGYKDCKLTFQSADVMGIRSRSSLDEDDEPWEDVWEAEESWTYERSRAVENITEELTAG
jgi:hypothetical protein